MPAKKTKKRRTFTDTFKAKVCMEARNTSVARALYERCARDARISIDDQMETVPANKSIDFHSTLLTVLTVLREAFEKENGFGKNSQ